LLDITEWDYEFDENSMTTPEEPNIPGRSPHWEG
jgi:hypothetical protein